MKKVIGMAYVILISIRLFGETKTVVELQQAALSENPRIKAMEAESQMMKQRIPQSDALEDPKLKVAANSLSAKTFSNPRDNMTSRGLGTSQVTQGKAYEEMPPYLEFGISQMIPIGKLGYRRKIAVQEYERAVFKLKAEKVETLHMLRMNYYELVFVRSSIKILEDIKRQIKLVIDSEVAATKAGMGSLSNVIKAKIESNMVDEEIIILRQKQKEIEEKINYLTGRRLEVKSDKLPEPDFKQVRVEAARKEIIASNPQLKIISLDTEISKSEISLKKSEYAPDVDIGFSYMRQRDTVKRRMDEVMIDMNGPSLLNRTEKMKRDDMVSFMVTFNIPFWFWKKNIPMVEEMKKKYDASKNLYQDKLNEVNARAETLVSQIVKWRDLYKLYRDKLIPQTQLALETNLARYRTGSVEFMPVVDTVRMLLRFKKELVMAVREYYTSYSELNALMGIEVLQ